MPGGSKKVTSRTQMVTVSLRIPQSLLDRIDKELKIRKRRVDPAYSRTRLLRALISIALDMEAGS